MTDSDGYGRYSAPGPTDSGYSAFGDGSPAGQDPYGGYAEGSSSSAPDPYATSAPSDPYAAPSPGPQSAPPGYTGPEFGQGALPYGGPVQPVYYAAPPTNGTATTALILGIVSLVLCGGVLSPIALVCGILGMKATADGTQGGRGLAIAGLVMGIVGTVLLLLYVLWFVFVIGVGIWGSTASY
ncbi:DUF4190 domain-containing protein [Brachybacterium hainanense]|uniref:DUF4190 domain-containing protein n=1 Tax=Brachybacterium hainanense TaxID=1541174 RepID=A0ABV6RAC3_9MICO